MKNPDSLWYDQVYRFSKQSKCLSRQVGAILVDQYDHMFGQGWNSAPAGSTTDDCPRCKNKSKSGDDLHLAICTHAEINAIAHAAKMGYTTHGSTLYSTTKPCGECTKSIISAGIVEVVYDVDYNSPITDMLFKNAGIKVRQFSIFPLQQAKIKIDDGNKVAEIDDYNCSFCGKSCFEVWKQSAESVIIKGDTGNICSKCIVACQQLLNKKDDIS